ncbi:MAG: UDP-N-acetylmuramoyl-L-alanine--D-glutamate ligase [Planctomycetota bacterium]
MSDTPPPKLNGPPHLAEARLALLKDWRGKRVTVMGLGWHGGQIAAIKYLARRGARLTVTDLLDESELADSLAALDGYRIDKFVLGRHDEDDFRTAEAVVVAPAVKPGNRFVRLAEEAGALITSEIELAIAETPGPLIGITGTVGKSTTATMCRDMLRAGGKRVRLVGNIGESLLDVVDDPADQFSAEDVTVFELSSFQLVRLESAEFRPDVAVLTGVSPNHLAWHGKFAAYGQVKRSVFVHQSAGDHAVVWHDDGEYRLGNGVVCHLIYPNAGRTTARFVEVDRTRRLVNVGIDPTRQPAHHEDNAAFAAAAAHACGVAAENIKEGYDRFRGLEYRFARTEAGGLTFVNDSKSTSDVAAASAANAVWQKTPRDRSAVIIDARTPFKQHEKMFAPGILGRCFIRYLTPGSDHAATDWPRADHLAPRGGLREAFAAATESLRAGGELLFSPGHPSQPAYRDYKERGEHFRRLVEEYRRSVEGV